LGDRHLVDDIVERDDVGHTRGEIRWGDHDPSRTHVLNLVPFSETDLGSDRTVRDIVVPAIVVGVSGNAPARFGGAGMAEPAKHQETASCIGTDFAQRHRDIEERTAGKFGRLPRPGEAAGSWIDNQHFARFLIICFTCATNVTIPPPGARLALPHWQLFTLASVEAIPLRFLVGQMHGPDDLGIRLGDLLHHLAGSVISKDAESGGLSFDAWRYAFIQVAGIFIAPARRIKDTRDLWPNEKFIGGRCSKGVDLLLLSKVAETEKPQRERVASW
jgi:hypothetical protein